MKTNLTHFLFATVSLFLINCSSDNEVFAPANLDGNLQDTIIIPIDPLSNIGAVEIPGFPKSIRKYQNDSLKYWTQYYYRPDGNLVKMNYSYPESGPEIFTDTYHYNSEGKLLKLNGHDTYTFYWDKDLIVKADKYNGMWTGRSEIFYTYNSEGELIEKTENNLDFFEREKTFYTYFEDGNLKTIEQYGDYNESGVYKLYFITSFEGYIEEKNLFLEVAIIPGQNLQYHFPTSMYFKHLTASGYDRKEIYDYKYDNEGRVVEKTFGNDKVVYEYY